MARRGSLILSFRLRLARESLLERCEPALQDLQPAGQLRGGLLCAVGHALRFGCLLAPAGNLVASLASTARDLLARPTSAAGDLVE